MSRGGGGGEGVSEKGRKSVTYYLNGPLHIFFIINYLTCVLYLPNFYLQIAYSHWQNSSKTTSANSVIADQNDGTYQLRISRETCIRKLGWLKISNIMAGCAFDWNSRLNYLGRVQIVQISLKCLCTFIKGLTLDQEEDRLVVEFCWRLGWIDSAWGERDRTVLMIS